jgi:hypothetical protein
MITLSGLELPVEDLGIASPQKVAWIRLPAVADIAQDWGPGQKTFTLSGRFFRVEGALDACLKLDQVKEKREPVLLRIDANSWQVQCQDFRYRRAGGVVTFDCDLVELVPPAEYIFAAAAEVKGVEISAGYLAWLRLKASAFWWRGISDRVAAWLTDAALEVAKLQDWFRDIGALAQLPANAIGSALRSADIVGSRMSLLISEIESEFSSQPRRYSDEEEVRKQALLAARTIRNRMALLHSALCNLQTANCNLTYVLPGDTLLRIADRWNREHGFRSTWQDIARANKISDPGAITPGQQLLVP